MLNVWSVKTGYSLGTLQERRVTSITLPTTGDLTGITFSKISGSLPAGLRIENNQIVGTTFEVSRSTVSTFVIRASKIVNGIADISDRTFSITVEGADAPRWITPGPDPFLNAKVWNSSTEYQAGDIFTYNDLRYRTIATAINIVPPNPLYYERYTEESGVLPVGVDPTRVSTVINASRDNFNRVTLTTELAHSFVPGNKVTIKTSLDAVNISAVYITSVTENTITYTKIGQRINSTQITGTISLLKDPLTFVLDGTYIDYQLQATDTDLRAGDELEFFIEEGNGILPPGLSLSRSGRITGFIDPILALDVTARDGFFDSNLFDAFPFDFGTKPNIQTEFTAGTFIIGETYRIETLGTTDFTTVGAVSNQKGEVFVATGVGSGTGTATSLLYESYYSVQTPRKLNRYYEFIVTVTDGESPAYRKFKIYVVGDDFLRADNTLMRLGSGAYSADSTYLRSPVWLSASNLGVKRANNYVTILLDAFDPNPAVGPVDYKLEQFNIDGTVSALPPGLFLDSSNSEIFGFVPYQPAVTTDYKFTVSAVKYDKENIEQVEVEIVVADDTPYGQNFIKVNTLPAEDQQLILNDSFRIGGYAYKVIAYEITGQSYDIIRLDKNLEDNLIDGFVISKTYNRLLSPEYTTRKSSKTFSIQILGEVDSVIKFITPSDLGSIRANIASRLEIQAQTTVTGAILTYSLVDGTLPPGVTLNSNGELIGRVTQFGNITYRSFWKSGKSYQIDDVVRFNNLLYKNKIAHTSGATFNDSYWERYTFLNNVTGLTTYDNRTTTFDGTNGTNDRSYSFTVLAQDQFKYSALKRTFTVFVEDPDVKLFSNIYIKPYPKKENRNLFYSFINNLDIFTPEKIYRSSDPNFGVQKDLRMLVYAGIETLDAGNYVSALSKNTKRKRFKLGSPKKAIAKETGSNEVIYEVIYLEVFDEYEVGKLSAPASVQRYDARNQTKINQARINPVDGALGTVVNGNVTYSSTNVQNKLNGDAVDHYRPVRDPVTVDMLGVKTSGNNIEYVYPSSIRNIRRNIKNIMLFEYYTCTNSHTSTVFANDIENWNKLSTVPELSEEWFPGMIYSPGNIIRIQTKQIDSENSFLPQWMITPQDNRTAATGYIKAIPLCYCKPGDADYILQNIKRSGFDFTNIDYEIDRFIIDSVSGVSSEQYLKFPNYKYNV